MTPDYPHTVAVVDTVQGNDWYRHNLVDALNEWNHCGARVVLRPIDAPPFEGGTITVYVDDDGVGQDGPYGDYRHGYGFVAVAGGWTRSREVLAHEVGHALGFGHVRTGYGYPPSVMGQAAHVTGADCARLRRWYP